MEKLALAIVSPRNVHLNLFRGAYNTKNLYEPCLSYYISMKLLFSTLAKTYNQLLLKKVNKIFQTEKDFISCSKLIQNELARFQTRFEKLLTSNKCCYQSLLLLFFSSGPIKFSYLLKPANKSTLNGAPAIEITKTWTVAFIKARNFLDIERKVSVGKRNRR